MGKWTGQRAKLPRLPEDKEYQPKVNEEKARILGLAAGQRPTKGDAEAANTAFLGRQMAKAKLAKAKINDRLYGINLTIAALEQLLRDRLEGEDQEKVELRGGISIGLKDDVYPMIEDRGKFFRWIKATKQIDLLSIHFKRFQAIVKEYITAGRPIPPGAKAYLKTSVTVRGLKGVANGEEKE